MSSELRLKFFRINTLCSEQLQATLLPAGILFHKLLFFPADTIHKQRSAAATARTQAGSQDRHVLTGQTRLEYCPRSLKKDARVLCQNMHDRQNDINTSGRHGIFLKTRCLRVGACQRHDRKFSSDMVKLFYLR